MTREDPETRANGAGSTGALDSPAPPQRTTRTFGVAAAAAAAVICTAALLLSTSWLEPGQKVAVSVSSALVASTTALASCVSTAWLTFFYAPMIVSDAAAAKALARQQQIMDAFARFDSVTKAVIGVGGWNPPNSTLHDALSRPERDLMRRSGVHADLSGALLDARGRPLNTPLSKRIIAISAQQLRRVPNVIGIAYGLEKVSAAHAAIRGGYVNSLVTDTGFAQRLLELSESAEAAVTEGGSGAVR